MRRHRGQRQRRRASWNVEALRRALQGEGIDTRTWTQLARVDDDDDAIRWDATLGFIVDVTFQGGPLDQTGPVACRLGTSFVGDGKLRSDPPVRAALVCVVLAEGNPNVSCSIVGVVSTPDLAAPTSVNGQDIDEDFAMANHLLVTGHSVQQEVGEKWRTSATSRATLEAPEVRLADEDADQPYVKGNAYADAEGMFLDALDVFVASISAGTGAPPNAALTVAQVLTAAGIFRPQITQFKNARQNYLSTKISGS